MKRVAVLASGRGSNLQALIEAEASGELGATLALVVVDRANTGASARAAAAGIPTATLPPRDFADRAAWDRALADLLVEAGIEIVVCAGFERILGPAVLTRFASRILNTHPSLLPAFAGGLHAPADAIRHGVKVSGCTVHLVTAELDAGPIVVQRAVAVHDDDTAESLAERIRHEEHRALPRAVRWLAEDRIVVDGRRTRILPPPAPTASELAAAAHG